VYYTQPPCLRVVLGLECMPMICGDGGTSDKPIICKMSHTAGGLQQALYALIQWPRAEAEGLSLVRVDISNSTPDEHPTISEASCTQQNNSHLSNIVCRPDVRHELSAWIHRPLARMDDRVVVRHIAESYLIGPGRCPMPTCYLACYEIRIPTFRQRSLCAPSIAGASNS
jgi:hypothetical protein